MERNVFHRIFSRNFYDFLEPRTFKEDIAGKGGEEIAT